MVSESKVREILFRGKRTDNGEWVNGTPFFGYPTDSCVMIQAMAVHPGFLEGAYYSECFPVAPKTVGQYTGLTDKNGKRIFEGDVLFEDYIGEDFATGEENVHQRDLFCVVWEDGGFKYFEACERLSDHNKYLFGVCDDSFCCQRECSMREIIGNIHDNPELLEVFHV